MSPFARFMMQWVSSSFTGPRLKTKATALTLTALGPTWPTVEQANMVAFSEKVGELTVSGPYIEQVGAMIHDVKPGESEEQFVERGEAVMRHVLRRLLGA